MVKQEKSPVSGRALKMRFSKNYDTKFFLKVNDDQASPLFHLREVVHHV